MTLALIAGTGALPPLLADTLVARGQDVLVCEADWVRSDIGDGFERETFRLETLGTFLGVLQARGVTQVCMAGTIRRPDIDPAAIDAATLPLVPVLQAALSKGDDSTLRAFMSLFEERGITVIGAHEVKPDLLPAEGVLTRAKPPSLTDEVALAREALTEMAAQDLGQAMILRDGAVAAREGEGGTDALLASSTGSGGFLFKAPKPGQVMQADMPTIGIGTAQGAVAAGLDGIVIAADGVMVLDQDAVIQLLDQHGLYLWVAP